MTHLNKAALLTMVFCLLVGCSESDSGEPPVAGTTDIVSKIAEQVVDTDGDGLRDSIDPYPDAAPLVAGLSRPVVRPVNSGVIVPGVIHAGYGAKISMLELDPSAAPYYAWLQREQGDSAVMLAIADDNTLYLSEAQTALPITAISIFNAQDSSQTTAIQWLDADAPLVTEFSQPRAGQRWLLKGDNLLDVTLELGGQMLEVTSRHATQIEVELPSDMTSNWLQVYQDGELRQQLELNPVREITVYPSSDLDAWSGLYINSVGEELPFDDAPVLVERAIGAQLVVVAGQEAPVVPVPLVAIAWPDQHSVVVNLDTLFAATAFRMKGAWMLHEPRDYAEQRDILEVLLSQPEAAKAKRHIHEALLAKVDYDYEYVRQQFIEASAGISVQKMQKTAQSSKPTTVFGRHLFEHGINHIVDGEPTPGRTFKAAITVDVEDNIACFLNIAANKPLGTTAADLCVRNGSIFFLSAQVKIRNDAGEMEVARPHVKVRPNPAVLSGLTEYSLLTGFDKDVLGASGALATVSFLTGEDNAPLCGMRYCEVELLIGSLDQYRQVDLGDTESQLVDALVTRKIVETIVLPLIIALSDQVGASIDKPCATAMFTTLVRQSTTLNDLRQKIDKNSTRAEIIAELNETFGQLAVDIIADQGNTLANNLLSCMPGANLEAKKAFAFVLREKVKAKVDRSFGSGAGGLAQAMKVAYDAIVLVDSLFNTAQKVTFTVSPLIEAKVKSDSFVVPDPNAQDVFNGISLSGDYLANGAGNNRPEFFPELVLEDVNGVQAILPSSASNFSRPANGDPSKDSALTFSEAELMAANVAKLQSGVVTMELALAGYDSDEFPDGKLRTPLGNIEFTGKSEIESFSPLVNFDTATDRRMLIGGFRLDKFDYSDFSKVNVVFTDSVGTEFIAPLEVAKTLADDPQDADRNFIVGVRLPANILPDLYSVTIKHTETSATLSAQRKYRVASENQLVFNWGDTGEDGNDDSIQVNVLTPAGGDIAGAAAAVPFVGGGSILSHSFDIPNSESHQLRFKCTNPGDNGVCTYGYRVFKPVATELISGKLKLNQCHTFTINKPKAKPVEVGSC